VAGGLILPPGFISGSRREIDQHDPINRGLLGYWSLDDGGAFVRDLTGRNHGLRINQPTDVPGKVGNALKFNGTNQYVSIPGKDGNSPTSITMCGWLKSANTSSGGPNGVLFGRWFAGGNRGFYLRRLNGDAFRILYATTSAADASWTPGFRFNSTYANKWNFIAVTYNANTGVLSFYVNDTIVNTTTITAAPLLKSIGPFGIGAVNDNGTWQQFLTDALDEVRLYDRPLGVLELRRLHREPTAGTSDLAERLFHAVRLGGGSSANVTLTGISLSASAGIVTEGLAVAAAGIALAAASGSISGAIGNTTTGAAATASAGSVVGGIAAGATGSGATVTPGSVAGALGASLAGAAASAGAGTAASAIGMAVTGASAMVMSAGSVAYTIGFLLTGVASTAAGGTLETDGADTSASRSLTGIQMRALPGNVRVTGGTRWQPQAPRTQTLPTLVGNTLPPPPRLTGDLNADTRAMNQWLSTLYDQLVKVHNVFGRVADHEKRIAALEADNDN